jgi:hypothetical protein
MMNKGLALLTMLLLGAAMVFASCAALQKPTEANFQDPTITLESFMVPQYDGYWYYGSKTKPTKGKAGNHGAPLPMSFLFNVKNPNPYPILLDDFRFTVAFDKEFDLVTVISQDNCWIPAGKTQQLRTSTLITVRSALLSLLVTGGFKLKAKEISAWDALERWWVGIPDYTVPVTVHEGAATFKADGVTKILAFMAEFP